MNVICNIVNRSVIEMAPRKNRNKLKAKIVCDYKAPCAFCQREIDDELIYGKLYAIGDIQCHYFCVLLSSCLIQKGRDEDGLFGFLYEDIITEVERSKKHRCSYCGQGGASLGCSVAQCKKQFHLPCGREKNAVSLYYGNYKSFCEIHAPKQLIPENIMSRAKLRMGHRKTAKRAANIKMFKEINNDETSSTADVESVCVICYERVEGFPTTQTFWPPCCARDAWFHRTCLQRMALSAGIHYLKCPLCNDKEQFYEAVVTQGYYVPDRDAAWELEQNAFSEIYERVAVCSAAACACPWGRGHDADTGPYAVQLCVLCGSSGSHVACGADTHHVCAVCRPAAPDDLEKLAKTIEAVMVSEERVASAARRGPRMRSRMSLRRTKPAAAHAHAASSSKAPDIIIKTEIQSYPSTPNTTLSRQDLNLKTPRKLSITFTPSQPSDVSQSPIKLIQEGLRSKGRSDVLDDGIVEELRRKFRKPKPLSMKRKIVNDLLDSLFENLLKEPKQKTPIKEWFSPKKCSDIKEECVEATSTPTRPSKRAFSPSPKKFKPELDNDSSNSSFELPPEFIADSSNDTVPIAHTPKKLKTFDIQHNSSLEISEHDQTINIDLLKITDTCQNDDYLKNVELKSPVKNKKCAFKFSPLDKEVLDNNNVDIDVESFKDHYLNEVVRDVPAKSDKKKNKRNKNISKEIVLKYKTANKRGKRSKKDIQVKIKWRTEQLKLKIKDSKKKKKKKANKYKQYILKCSSDDKSKIAKPNFDLSPMKRKYIKQDKSPDNLVQTSIDRFFIVKPAKE